MSSPPPTRSPQYRSPRLSTSVLSQDTSSARIGHAIDDRAAGLRELIDRRNEVRHFPRVIRITDVVTRMPASNQALVSKSGIGRILEVLGGRVNAEARTARTEVGAPGEVIDGHGGDRPGVLFRTGVAALRRSCP